MTSSLRLDSGSELLLNPHKPFQHRKPEICSFDGASENVLWPHENLSTIQQDDTPGRSEVSDHGRGENAPGDTLNV